MAKHQSVSAGVKNVIEEIEQKSAALKEKTHCGSTRMMRDFRTVHSLVDWETSELHRTDTKVARCLMNSTTETMLSLLVVYNLIIVVVETDAQAGEVAVPMWAQVSNYALLISFTCELVVKMVVFHETFFKDPWCVMDFLVVVPDVILEVVGAFADPDAKLSKVSFFRVLRLLRLARAVRVLSWFPELFALVKGLAFAFRAIFWGTILILLILMIWSVMAVQFIKPLMDELKNNNPWPDCERCAKAFDSVPRAMLTFIQQIVAGDSWGAVTVPVIEAYPVTSLYFVAVLVSVGLAILNLILAVIVDKADDAKQDSLRIAADKKAREQAEAKETLKGICSELDTDGGGQLSYTELMTGFTNNRKFLDICLDMDIHEEDMNVVWSMLDSDGSGSVSYNEFCDQLYRMKNDDSHTLLVFIKVFVGDIKKNVGEELQLLRGGFLQKLEAVLLRLDEQQGKSLQADVSQSVEAGPSAPPADAALEEKRCEDPQDGLLSSLAQCEAEVTKLRETNAGPVDKLRQVDCTVPEADQTEKKRESSPLEAELGRLCAVNSELVTQIKNLNRQYEISGGFRDALPSQPAFKDRSGVCGLRLCSTPGGLQSTTRGGDSSLRRDDEVVPIPRV